jgi:hypothetical protein
MRMKKKESLEFRRLFGKKCNKSLSNFSKKLEPISASVFKYFIFFIGLLKRKR